MCRVGVPLFGIALCEEAEEGFVAGEFGEVLTTFFYAHGLSALHAVGINEREVVPSVYFVVEDVGGREVAVEESVFVEMGGIACEGAHHFAFFVGCEFCHVLHVVAIGGVEADEVGGVAEESVAVYYEGYAFGAFKSSFAQE